MSNNNSNISDQVDNLLEVFLEDKGMTARDSGSEHDAEWDCDVTIHNVDPVLRGLVARVVWDFLKALVAKGIDLEQARNEACRRSMGGELYLTWSKTGAGFFDHGTELGDQLQEVADKTLPGEFFFDSIGCSGIPTVDINLISSAIDGFLTLRKTEAELIDEIDELVRMTRGESEGGEVDGWVDGQAAHQMLISYPRQLLGRALIAQLH